MDGRAERRTAVRPSVCFSLSVAAFVDDITSETRLRVAASFTSRASSHDWRDAVAGSLSNDVY